MTSIRDHEEPISSPSYIARSVMERSNFLTDGWYQLNKFWRRRVSLSLMAISLATLAVAGGTKQMKGDLMRYRPFVALTAYSALAVGAARLTDAIRFRREGAIGWQNSAETRIEFTEDVVQQAGDRRYNPFGAVRTEQVSGTTEQTTAESAPPAPDVEDVAQSVVNSRLPVLIVAGTGAGKTTVLERIIYTAKTQDDRAQIHLFDGKPTADRLIAGIKRTRGYHSVVNVRDIPSFEMEMRSVVDTMMSDSRGPNSDRMLILCDEINNACKKADLYKLDQEELQPVDRDKRNYREYLQNYQGLIISQGREKNCLGVATTHTANTQALGIDSNERNNNSFLVLGSAQSFDNIELLLSGTGVRLITNPKTLDRLQAQYEAHKHLLFQGFYALTNINGDWRLVRLPDWRGDCPSAFTTSDEKNTPQTSPIGGAEYLNKSRETGAKSIVESFEVEPRLTMYDKLNPKQREKLREQIYGAIGDGKSMTWIVENVVKMKGARFKEGKELYLRLTSEACEAKG